MIDIYTLRIKQQLNKLVHPDRASVIGDVAAGVTGAIAGAPQALGFALLAGVSPLYGLYAAIVPTIAGAILSPSRFITNAPTNVLMLLVASGLASLNTENPVQYLFAMTILIGLFQIAFGVLKLGGLTRFLSNAVMVGFIVGAGLLIILGQLDHMVGYDTHAAAAPILTLWSWFTRLGETIPHTLIIGLFATLVIYRLHHTRFKPVATLIAIVITTIWVQAFGWHDVALVSDIAQIPNALPVPIIPDFSQAIPLLQFAFVTAALASAQSVALADSMREREPVHISPNREFMAQGIANVLGGLFQSLPASASLSRTAVNISAGAKTRMANLLAGVFIAISVLLFGNLLELIPLAALAGHLIVAALSLIDRTAIKLVWSVSTPARVTLLVTLISTLVLPLEWSLILGVGTRVLFYLRETSRDPQVVQLEMNGTYFVERPAPAKLISRQPVIVSLRDTLNFASIKSLDDFLPDPTGVEAPCVILRLRNQPTLGSTGIRLLLRYHTQIQRQGGHLLLSGVLPPLRKELEKSGALATIGAKNVFFADDRLFHATEQALYRAQAWLVGL